MKIIADSELRRGCGDNSHINLVIGWAGTMANTNIMWQQIFRPYSTPRFEKPGPKVCRPVLDLRKTHGLFLEVGGVLKGE